MVWNFATGLKRMTSSVPNTAALELLHLLFIHPLPDLDLVFEDCPNATSDSLTALSSTESLLA
jgi:hypothetical protein